MNAKFYSIISRLFVTLEKKKKYAQCVSKYTYVNKNVSEINVEVITVLLKILETP